MMTLRMGRGFVWAWVLWSSAAMASGDPNPISCDTETLIQCGTPTPDYKNPGLVKLLVVKRRCGEFSDQRARAVPHIVSIAYTPSAHETLITKADQIQNEISVFSPGRNSGNNYPFRDTEIRVFLDSRQGEGMDATYSAGLSNSEGVFTLEDCKLEMSPEAVVAEINSVVTTWAESRKDKKKHPWWWPF